MYVSRLAKHSISRIDNITPYLTLSPSGKNTLSMKVSFCHNTQFSPLLEAENFTES